MKQFGFTKEFIQSGDFRVHLAMAAPGTDRRQHFEEVMAMDGLITVNKEGRQTLQYSQEAVANYTQFLKAVHHYRPVEIPAMHARGTCVLAGSGNSLNVQMLRDFSEKGIPIIAMGNASSLLPFANYWVGNGDILGYHPAPIERHNTVAFVRRRFYQDKVWDHTSKRQVGVTPEEAVATLRYVVNIVSAEDFFAHPQALTTFGIPSTFTVGLALAATLGFNNIVLNGVDLGGPVDTYFAFGEIPHKDTLDRKTALYEDVKEIFPEIFKQFWKHGIRISAVNESPLKIPTYPLAYMNDILDNVMTLSRRIKPRHSIATPAALNRRHIELQAKHRAAVMAGIHVLDALPALMRDLPEHFDVDEARSALAAVQQAEASGGCSPCTKNKVSASVYTIFEKLVVNNLGVIEEAWKKHLPEQYIVQARHDNSGRYVFRSDKLAEEQEYKEMVG